ncbi:hypothetical protein BCR33DRAFT_129392 [Rhizoclosmatium globosum]|uniref:Uncharacterized protein n=1 Tax=Rhizoclosmatium globosum TaxID=329046 RepID=A0A1Y2CHG5_9FUNG|nr:hypothetical protein BCR33DRAFT_129392 [Rhizoclosmatium globosum]|eukprot:ORY46479.1 hypothetical protein BCR33DRAFT_129392 [Rhizoclosmatium globosum]
MLLRSLFRFSSKTKNQRKEMIQSGEPLTTKLICPVPGCGCIILGKEGAVKDSDFVLEPKYF